MVNTINLSQKGTLFDSIWTPKIVSDLNDQHVKLAKFEGEFGWHSHENEDELFYVVDGDITIQTREESFAVRKGELIVIPKGVEHNPISEKRSLVMLIEPMTTVNTGNQSNDKTQVTLERI